MYVLTELLKAHGAIEAALWHHARVQHREHSPEPQRPTEYLSCMREPCKTVRNAIGKPADKDEAR